MMLRRPPQPKAMPVVSNHIDAVFTGTPEVNDYAAVAGSSWTLN